MSAGTQKRKPFFHKYQWYNKKKKGEGSEASVKKSSKKDITFQILRNDAFGVEKCKNENANDFFQSLESSEYGKEDHYLFSTIDDTKDVWTFPLAQYKSITSSLRKSKITFKPIPKEVLSVFTAKSTTTDEVVKDFSNLPPLLMV